MTTIAELMQDQVVSVPITETVNTAVARMCHAGVGAIVLVEGEALRGIFTERDLLMRVVSQGLDPAATPLRDVATLDVVSVVPDTSVRECASVLQGKGVRHLPVTDDNKPVGVISSRDFFEKMTGELETLIGRLRYDEALKEMEDPYDHIGGSYGR